MPTYSYRKPETDAIKDVKCSVHEYEELNKKLADDGWIRILKPVAIRDSGSGR